MSLYQGGNCLPLNLSRVSPGGVGIMFCPPNVTAGLTLVPRQPPCFPGAQHSIRPCHAPMGFNGRLFPLKMSEFTWSHFTAPNALTDSGLLSLFT